MCLPWNHKWETVQKDVIGVRDDRDLLIEQKLIIQQRCIHCGKEIVRKYRV